MTKPLLLCLLAAISPALAANPAQPATTAVNALGIELLGLMAKPWESTLLSPYSIQSALAMTYAGAEGDTREQMAKVLHYPAGDVSAAFSSLQQQLDTTAKQTEKIAETSKKFGGPSEPITLVAANRLFGQKGYDFRDAYLALLKDKYGASLDQLDFQKNPVNATKTINAWVEKQTRNRIRNLIPSPLSPDARLVLVNAIYLKAPWAKEFVEGATVPEPFHSTGGSTSNVPTMVQGAMLGYAKQDGFSAVALPYAGDDLQFLILLPDAVNGLPALEQKLTPDLLAKCASLKTQKVIIHLPKFKLEPPLFQLSLALEKLGMKSAFDIPPGSANFDAIAPRKPTDYLYISEIFHKAFLAIDEKGTEAAAATAVAMMAGARYVKEPDPIEVRVDRPFLFAIQHRPTGACLFLGRMVKPAL